MLHAIPVDNRRRYDAGDWFGDQAIQPEKGQGRHGSLRGHLYLMTQRMHNGEVAFERHHYQIHGR